MMWKCYNLKKYNKQAKVCGYPAVMQICSLYRHAGRVISNPAHQRIKLAVMCEWEGCSTFSALSIRATLTYGHL